LSSLAIAAVSFFYSAKRLPNDFLSKIIGVKSGLRLFINLFFLTLIYIRKACLARLGVYLLLLAYIQSGN